MRAWYSGIISAFQAEDGGSIPLARSNNVVNCSNCHKEITNLKDVNVTALLGILVKTWCNDCYAARERGILRHIFYKNNIAPLNSTYYTLTLSVTTIIIGVVAIAMVGGKGTWTTVGGQPPTLSSLIPYAIIVFIILAWGWALWIVARRIVRKIEKQKPAGQENDG